MIDLRLYEFIACRLKTWTALIPAPREGATCASMRRARMRSFSSGLPSWDQFPCPPRKRCSSTVLPAHAPAKGVGVRPESEFLRIEAGGLLEMHDAVSCPPT